MNTEEALELLKQHGITDSLQTLRRWLREGRIKAERGENRKVGYIIDEDDLMLFIERNAVTDKDKLIDKLTEELRQKDDELKVMKEREQRIQELIDELIKFKL